MKKIIFALLVFIIAKSLLSYYEEVPEVRGLVRSGSPILAHNSKECSSDTFKAKFTDKLGIESGYDLMCVNHLALPKEVLKEIIQMDKIQLENDSDYDSRVTKIYYFKQQDFSPSSYVKKWQLKKLMKHLGIKTVVSPNTYFRSFLGNEDNITTYNYLTPIDEYADYTKTRDYLIEIMKDKLILEITIQDGIDLYPGGGLYVDYHIYILEGELIYVKQVWWNS